MNDLLFNAIWSYNTIYKTSYSLDEISSVLWRGKKLDHLDYECFNSKEIDDWDMEFFIGLTFVSPSFVVHFIEVSNDDFGVSARLIPTEPYDFSCIDIDEEFDKYMIEQQKEESDD